MGRPPLFSQLSLLREMVACAVSSMHVGQGRSCLGPAEAEAGLRKKISTISWLLSGAKSLHSRLLEGKTTATGRE